MRTNHFCGSRLTKSGNNKRSHGHRVQACREGSSTSPSTTLTWDVVEDVRHTNVVRRVALKLTTLEMARASTKAVVRGRLLLTTIFAGSGLVFGRGRVEPMAQSLEHLSDFRSQVLVVRGSRAITLAVTRSDSELSEIQDHLLKLSFRLALGAGWSVGSFGVVGAGLAGVDVSGSSRPDLHLLHLFVVTSVASSSTIRGIVTGAVGRRPIASDVGDVLLEVHLATSKDRVRTALRA